MNCHSCFPAQSCATRRLEITRADCLSRSTTDNGRGNNVRRTHSLPISFQRNLTRPEVHRLSRSSPSKHWTDSLTTKPLPKGTHTAGSTALIPQPPVGAFTSSLITKPLTKETHTAGKDAQRKVARQVRGSSATHAAFAQFAVVNKCS